MAKGLVLAENDKSQEKDQIKDNVIRKQSNYNSLNVNPIDSKSEIEDDQFVKCLSKEETSELDFDHLDFTSEENTQPSPKFKRQRWYKGIPFDDNPSNLKEVPLQGWKQISSYRRFSNVGATDLSNNIMPRLVVRKDEKRDIVKKTDLKDKKTFLLEKDEILRKKFELPRRKKKSHRSSELYQSQSSYVEKVPLPSDSHLHERINDNKTVLYAANQTDIPNEPDIIVYPHKHELDIFKSFRQQKEMEKMMPGSIYQLKLLMLFLKREMITSGSFHLGGEIGETKKKLNLVFEIDNYGEKQFRLLTRHKEENENKKINFNDLLMNLDSDFCLVKYYFSLQDFKKEKFFQSGNIKNVIINTNINVDLFDTYDWFGKIKTIQDTVKEIETKDIIIDLNNENLTKSPKCYQFNENIIPLLKEKLECYKLVRLAKNLAKCILKNNVISHQEDDFKPFHTALSIEVIDVKNKKFHEHFIKGENLSYEADIFRDSLINELKKQSDNKLNLKNINRVINDENNIEVGLKLSKGFGSSYENEKDWPQNLIPEKSINELLKCLVIAVDQPNEQELTEIIARDINTEFGFYLTDKLYKDFFDYMVKWLNYEEERYISPQNVKQIFENTLQKLLELEFPAISLKYKTNIEIFNITFNLNNDFNLINFLNEHNQTNQILNIINQQPLLSTIKINQILKGIPQHQSDSFFIDLTLAQFCFPILIRALNSNNVNLVVIESEKTENVEELSSFYDKILNILQFLKGKKIILVTKNDYKFISTVEKVNFIKQYENISINDLTSESQNQVLKNGIVLFQGKRFKLFSIMVKEQLKHYINSEILLKLIKNEEIDLVLK